MSAFPRRALSGRLSPPANAPALRCARKVTTPVNTASAKTIGLVNFPPDRIVPSGNTALRGAKRALFDEPGAYDELASGVRHIALDSDGDFQDVYVEEMRFPTETGDR